MSATFNRVAALTRRDLAIELSYHFQLYMRFATVLITVLIYFFLSRLIGNAEELDRYGGVYFRFVLIGVVVMGFAQAFVTSLARSVQNAQADGTLEILLSTPTPLSTLMLGSLGVPTLLAALEAAVLLVLGWLLVGLTLPPGGMLLAAVLLLLTVGTFAAVGILSAAVIVLTKRGDPFSNLALQASMLLAGAIFPIAVMPEWMQAISHLIPAFYGLRGIREVLLAGSGLSEVIGDLVALAAFNVILVPLSLLILTKAIGLARVTGTLGNR